MNIKREYLSILKAAFVIPFHYIPQYCKTYNALIKKTTFTEAWRFSFISALYVRFSWNHYYRNKSGSWNKNVFLFYRKNPLDMSCLVPFSTKCICLYTECLRKKSRDLYWNIWWERAVQMGEGGGGGVGGGGNCTQYVWLVNQLTQHSIVAFSVKERNLNWQHDPVVRWWSWSNSIQLELDSRTSKHPDSYFRTVHTLASSANVTVAT